MAMISGPYTDAVVKMIMGEEPALEDGAILIEPGGRVGALFGREVWVADPVVRAVPAATFDIAHSQRLRFPVPFEDTLRFLGEDGSIFIPEYAPEDKELLRRWGYSPVSGETLERALKEAGGTARHRWYPLCCKIGVYGEKEAETIAGILLHLYD